MYRNNECRKKSHRKKSHGKKVTDLGRKKSHRKKSHKNENFFFFYFMLEMDIIIFIITIIIENVFVWVDVLRPDYQFSAMPGWSYCFLSTKPVIWELIRGLFKYTTCIHYSISVPSHFPLASWSTIAPPCPIY